MSRRCRDCVHLERAGNIFHCGKGRWDKYPYVPQWYALSTVMRNRLPLSAYAPRCGDFMRKDTG